MSIIDIFVKTKMLIYFYLVFMTKEFCLPFFYTNKRKYDIIFKRFPCTGAYKVYKS